MCDIIMYIVHYKGEMMDSKVLITEAMKLIEKECDPTIIRVVDGEKQPSEEVMYLFQLQILGEDLEIDRVGVESMLGSVFCELYSAFLEEKEQLSNDLKAIYMEYKGLGEKEFSLLLSDYKKLLEEDAREEQKIKSQDKKKKRIFKWMIIALIAILIIIVLVKLI